MSDDEDEEKAVCSFVEQGMPNSGTQQDAPDEAAPLTAPFMMPPVAASELKDDVVTQSKKSTPHSEAETKSDSPTLSSTANSKGQVESVEPADEAKGTPSRKVDSPLAHPPDGIKTVTGSSPDIVQAEVNADGARVVAGCEGMVNSIRPDRKRSRKRARDSGRSIERVDDGGDHDYSPDGKRSKPLSLSTEES